MGGMATAVSPNLQSQKVACCAAARKIAAPGLIVLLADPFSRVRKSLSPSLRWPSAFYIAVGKVELYCRVGANKESCSMGASTGVASVI